MNFPFSSQPHSGSYFNLQQRMFERVQSSKVNDHISEIIQMAYEEALAVENVALTHAENKRLFSQILKLVLEDMLK
jgi:hypothetical protein